MFFYRDRTVPPSSPKPGGSPIHKKPFPANKIIWICWLQGWDEAPWLVRKCLASWQLHNPDWDIRILDADTVHLYVELPDLSAKLITAASLSDIVRVCLLHEYGGVWVDATLLCHRPLDSWLPKVMTEGFFAFQRPTVDLMPTSWFIATREGHPLIERWHAAVIQYWNERDRSDYYFWLRGLFWDSYNADPLTHSAWDAVPHISAEPCHTFQKLAMLEAHETVIDNALRSLPPVSKLTYNLDQTQFTGSTLVSRLLAPLPEPELPISMAKVPDSMEAPTLVSLKVGTNNLGDHLQIIASQRLIDRKYTPQIVYVDRDDEIGSCLQLDQTRGPYPIVINGWFKTNGKEWPPNPILDPVIIGFHIRPSRCPELLSPEAISYYQTHAPIGCRDPYTYDTLTSRGVRCYHSGCLTLSFPRRAFRPETQTEVFVVSRDEEILSILPPFLSHATFISHYVDGNDFEINLQAGERLLTRYETRAKLIVTTLLHCALPALAMGIPVVLFYPHNTIPGHASDVERFSAISKLIPIYRFDEIARVDWNPTPLQIGAEKLAIIDNFYHLTERWNLIKRVQPLRIAPSHLLLPPE